MTGDNYMPTGREDEELMREALETLGRVQGDLIVMDRWLEAEYVTDGHGHILAAGESLGAAQNRIRTTITKLEQRLLEE